MQTWWDYASAHYALCKMVYLPFKFRLNALKEDFLLSKPRIGATSLLFITTIQSLT